MVGWIIEYKKLNSEEITHHLNKKLHAQMACSAAIKARDVINNEQIQQRPQYLEFIHLTQSKHLLQLE